MLLFYHFLYLVETTVTPGVQVTPLLVYNEKFPKDFEELVRLLLTACLNLYMFHQLTF